MSAKGFFLGVVAAVASISMSAVTHAACPGAAPSTALQSFNADPGGFMKANGGAPDVAAQITALAAAAVNAKDKGFGKALGTALGGASVDQGKAIGSALGKLGGSCSDPLDPSDRGDKAYISTNIAPNMLTNIAANAAYGLTLDGTTQTASTGGAGGGNAGGGGGAAGGSGIGGQTGSSTTGSGGGGSAGAPTQSTFAATNPAASPGFGGGGGSVSSTTSQNFATPTAATVLSGSANNE